MRMWDNLISCQFCNDLASHIISFSSYRLQEPSENTLHGKNGLHAFGNNSAESEVKVSRF